MKISSIVTNSNKFNFSAKMNKNSLKRHSSVNFKSNVLIMNTSPMYIYMNSLDKKEKENFVKDLQKLENNNNPDNVIIFYNNLHNRVNVAVSYLENGKRYAYSTMVGYAGIENAYNMAKHVAKRGKHFVDPSVHDGAAKYFAYMPCD